MVSVNNQPILAMLLITITSPNLQIQNFPLNLLLDTYIYPPGMSLFLAISIAYQEHVKTLCVYNFLPLWSFLLC